MKTKNKITRKQIERALKVYCDAAEHQDGTSFWANFKDVHEVFEDIARYNKGRTYFHSAQL